MATPVTAKIDIPLVLWRLVPTAEYLWKGNGPGLYADIGEWRSPDIPKPTEVQVYAEWDKYLTEKTASDSADATLRNQVLTLAGSAVGVQIDQLTAAQVRALVAILLWKAGALTSTGAVKPLNQWV